MFWIGDRTNIFFHNLWPKGNLMTPSKDYPYLLSLKETPNPSQKFHLNIEKPKNEFSPIWTPWSIFPTWYDLEGTVQDSYTAHLTWCLPKIQLHFLDIHFDLNYTKTVILHILHDVYLESSYTFRTYIYIILGGNK